MNGRGLIIIPAFNEARSLPSVLVALKTHAPTWDVCVVDDGSTDETAAVAKRAGANIILKAVVNLGIGGAVQTGYLWAREQGYDIAVQVDGDGQHDPRFLPSLVSAVASGQADLAIGSRFLEGSSGFKSTRLRRLGISYLAWFLRLRCGVCVTDPTSGFRVAGRRAIELFANYYPSDYPEPESIALAARQGLKILEQPVEMSARTHGTSSIDAWRTVYYLIKVTTALLLLPSRGPKQKEQLK